MDWFNSCKSSQVKLCTKSPVVISWMSADDAGECSISGDLIGLVTSISEILSDLSPATVASSPTVKVPFFDADRDGFEIHLSITQSEAALLADCSDLEKAKICLNLHVACSTKSRS